MNESNDILLLSYYFPPLGMGGVGRPYALAKYLPDYGYRVHVVSVKKVLYPAYDYGVALPEGKASIHRTGSLDPSRLLYLLGKRKLKASGYSSITGKWPVYLPDLKRGWNRFAFGKAVRLIENNNIKTVITTSPPPSTHMIGLKLKEKFDIKWIADFRDFWFPQPIEKIYRHEFTKRFALRLKNEILEKADEVVAVNEDIRNYLGRGEVICNGGDEELIDIWQKGSTDAKEFRIGMYGTFNEIVPAEPLFTALRKIIDRNADGERKITIIHGGHADEDLRRTIDKYELNDRVRLLGYLPKEQAVEELSVCDAFYLAVRENDGYYILPGRTFDLLLSGKPLFGVVPHGSAIEKLLRGYPSGHMVIWKNENALADLIMHLWKYRGSWPQLKEKSRLHRYTGRRLAEEYRSLIENLVQK